VPDVPAPRRVAAFFDLDKTIIATSSATAFARPLYASGLLTRRDVLRTAFARTLFQLGGADAAQTERLRAALAATVTGWDVAELAAQVAGSLETAIRPVVFAEALDLMAEHHGAGHDVVIVSASGVEVVEPIARLLGADDVVATRMEVVDGRYTGEVERYVYGPAKADAIRELAAARGYDLAASHAYSDSITDVPMLEAVGHPAAVNPGRALRRVAAERGWQVLTFAKPVRLSSTWPHPAWPGLVVAGALVAALVAVTLAHRSRGGVRAPRPPAPDRVSRDRRPFPPSLLRRTKELQQHSGRRATHARPVLERT
jgi:HAD superfamily hydrolase (TIGR01490 family)